MYRRHHSHSHNASNMSSYNCGGIQTSIMSSVRKQLVVKRVIWILFSDFFSFTVSAQDGSYVQYVDSELYTTTTGQESSQM